MRFLALNPGSNSVKFELIEAEPGRWGRRLAKGVIDPIGGKNRMRVHADSGEPLIESDCICETHVECVAQILREIDAGRLAAAGVARVSDIQAAACRVVHGGAKFQQPVAADDAVIAEIERLDELAPLHNAAAAAVLRACRASVQGPVLAVFDSAFHHTLPERAYRYAIPWELAERHGIRRIGFHGLSHEYLTRRYAELRGIPVEDVKAITLHLEGGSSAAAILGGRSVDTSMGMTPLEGLMMGTRCGDIDPAMAGFLARKERVDVAAVEKILNRNSGLLGVSGHSQDTRELCRIGDARSALALEMFSYRVLKYVGAYLAALDGAEAVLFGGGIGENTPSVRAYVCQGLSWMGLDFDDAANAQANDQECRITRAGSRLHAYVIPTQENLMMVRLACEAIA